MLYPGELRGRISCAIVTKKCACVNRKRGENPYEHADFSGFLFTDQ